jgi:hypothetical protein
VHRLLPMVVAVACLTSCYVYASPLYRRPYAVPSTTPRYAPPPRAPTEIAVPARLHWCSAHCSTWVWAGNRYVGEGTQNPERTPQCGVWVEQFSPESVIMHRVDCGPYPGRAVLTGRLSPDGNTIIGGVINWTWHPCCGVGAGRFVAAWGPAIDTVPGDDGERARRMQGHRDSPPPRPGLTREQQLLNAAIEVAGAIVADAIGKNPAAPDWVRVLALVGRDPIIDGALHDAFPGLRPSQVKAIRFFIVSMLDDKLTVTKFIKHFSKEALMDLLRQADPDLADVAELADFIYNIANVANELERN